MNSFEFKGFITKENAKDYFSSVKIVKQIRNSSIFMISVLSALTALLISVNIQTGKFLNLIIAVVFVLLIFIIYAAFMPSLFCRSYFKNQRAIFNTEHMENDTIFSDKIYITSVENRTVIEYAQIKSIVDNKSVIALLMGSNTGIIVPKNNIIDANINDFISFIENKTNAKCKKNKSFSAVLPVSILLALVLCFAVIHSASNFTVNGIENFYNKDRINYDIDLDELGNYTDIDYQYSQKTHMLLFPSQSSVLDLTYEEEEYKKQIEQIENTYTFLNEPIKDEDLYLISQNEFTIGNWNFKVCLNNEYLDFYYPGDFRMIAFNNAEKHIAYLDFYDSDLDCVDQNMAEFVNEYFNYNFD
mgnify:CR=1 FL=1